MQDLISKSVQTSFVSIRKTLPDHLVKNSKIGLFDIPLTTYLPVCVFSILTENPVLNIDVGLEQDYLPKWPVELGMFWDRLLKQAVDSYPVFSSADTSIRRIMNAICLKNWKHCICLNSNSIVLAVTM